MFINWNEPITIVEGAFDAIAVRNNAIPLFGTIMSNKLKESIIERGVCEVNIMLDNDALSKAIKIFEDIEKLKTQKVDVYIVQLKDKDPSVLGFEKVNILIDDQTKPFDFAESIRLKMKL
jgi:DNA primase